MIPFRVTVPQALVVSPVMELLAASGRRAEATGRQVAGDEPTVQSQQVLIVLTCLLVAAIVAWLVSYRVRARNTTLVNNPRKLFRELCRAFRLSYRDRRLLSEIADWHALPQPAMLFLDPTRFKNQDMLEELGRAEQIRKLEDRLFGEP